MHILHIQHTELWLLNNQEASNKTWIKLSLRAFFFVAFFPKIFSLLFICYDSFGKTLDAIGLKKELLDLPDEY